MAATVLLISKRVEKAFLRVLKAVGEPWKLSRRGRKPLRSPRQYALALFAKAFYGSTCNNASTGHAAPAYAAKYGGRTTIARGASTEDA